MWKKEEAVIIITFKPAHVWQILSACGSNDFLSVKDQTVLSSLFETGIRYWELCYIKSEDIHDDSIPHMPLLCQRPTKEWLFTRKQERISFQHNLDIASRTLVLYNSYIFSKLQLGRK